MCTFYAITEITPGRVYQHHWMNQERGYPVQAVCINVADNTVTIRDGWGDEWDTNVAFLRPAVDHYRAIENFTSTMSINAPEDQHHE